MLILEVTEGGGGGGALVCPTSLPLTLICRSCHFMCESTHPVNHEIYYGDTLFLLRRSGSYSGKCRKKERKKESLERKKKERKC